MSKSISDISISIGSGITPLRSNSLFWNSKDYMWLKTEQLGQYQIFQTNEYISKQALKQTSIKLYPINTISVAMYGEGKTRGSVSILKEEMTTNQACCNIIVDDKQADYRFLYYWIKSNYDSIRSLSSGVRKNLNSEDIKSFPFKDFNLPTQQKIANVLSAIDEKIELNNKINAELETLAKTIYDYWFLQFEFPDENGKPYKSNGGKMEYNEQLKRKIPVGWEVGSLTDIANILMGQSPSGDTYNEIGEGTVFFQGRTDFGNRFPMVRMYTTEPSRIANKGDILLSVRAPVGDINIASEKCCIGRGLSALNSKTSHNSYLFYLMLKLRPLFDVYNGSGTTFGAINKDTLHDINVLIPQEETLNSYEKMVSEFDEKIFESSMENQQLTSLRDWLLPMLMNGQVTIK